MKSATDYIVHNYEIFSHLIFSSLLEPDIVFHILLLNTLSLCYFLNVTKQF
jgi:hypothetical protein